MSASNRHVSPIAIVLAAALGGAVTGCSLVVGSGDYVIGNVGDGSTETPDAALGPDGQPAPPVDGGVPGMDAMGQPDTATPPAEAGLVGDGGTAVCGPGGTLNPGGLPTSDPTFQQLVDACVLTVSCDPLFFDVTVSDCITNDYLASYPTTCLAGIKSCADYYTCMGSRIATLAECAAASNADTDQGSCSNGIATSCSSFGDGIVSNCAALGGTCTVFHEADYDVDFPDTSAGCQLGTACDDTPSGLQCFGVRTYSCDDTDTATTQGISRQTCPGGSACQSTNGTAECLATAPACATAGTSCASATTLTTCIPVTSGNQQYTSDCTAAGLTCTTSVAGTAACTAAGCANSGCGETCNGNTLHTCIGGAPLDVDCTTLGFNTCDNGSNVNDVSFSFCAYQ